MIIDDQTTGLSYFIFLKIVGLHIKPAYHGFIGWICESQFVTVNACRKHKEIIKFTVNTNG